jgi:hypothetical protein
MKHEQLSRCMVTIDLQDSQAFKAELLMAS